MRWRFYIAFLLTATAVACTKNYESFNAMTEKLLNHSVPELTPSDINEAELAKYVVLDARELCEYEVSHLKDAVYIGYNDFDISRMTDIERRSEIIVYCSVGYRSEKIAEQLHDEDYANVYNLVGGIFGWVNSGKTVVDSDGVITDRVHAYNKDWGVWLTKGEKIYE